MSTHIIGPTVRLMFIQGIWSDDSATNPDFYRQHLGARAADLLSRHAPLNLAFRLFRASYLWSMIIYLSLHVAVFCPAAILKRDVAASMRDVICMLVIYTFLLTGLLMTVAFKRRIHATVNMIDEISRADIHIHEEYTEALVNLKWFCQTITHHIQVTFLPFVSFATIIYNFTELIPKRKLYFSGIWYPFDQTASPYYEMVLFVSSVIHVMLAIVQATLMTFVVFVCLNLCVHFKAVSYELSNLRRQAVLLIQARRARLQNNP